MNNFWIFGPLPPTSAYVMYEWSQTVWLLAFLACVEWSILLIFLAFKVFISAISIFSIIPKFCNCFRSMYFIYFHSTIFRSFISIKSYPALLKRIVLFCNLCLYGLSLPINRFWELYNPIACNKLAWKTAKKVVCSFWESFERATARLDYSHFPCFWPSFISFSRAASSTFFCIKF